jgi:hypothetical protein
MANESHLFYHNPPHNFSIQVTKKLSCTVQFNAFTSHNGTNSADVHCVTYTTKGRANNGLDEIMIMVRTQDTIPTTHMNIISNLFQAIESQPIGEHDTLDCKFLDHFNAVLFTKSINIPSNVTAPYLNNSFLVCMGVQETELAFIRRFGVPQFLISLGTLYESWFPCIPWTETNLEQLEKRREYFSTTRESILETIPQFITPYATISATTNETAITLTLEIIRNDRMTKATTFETDLAIRCRLSKHVDAHLLVQEGRCLCECASRILRKTKQVSTIGGTFLLIRLDPSHDVTIDTLEDGFVLSVDDENKKLVCDAILKQRNLRLDSSTCCGRFHDMKHVFKLKWCSESVIVYHDPSSGLLQKCGNCHFSTHLEEYHRDMGWFFVALHGIGFLSPHNEYLKRTSPNRIVKMKTCILDTLVKYLDLVEWSCEKKMIVVHVSCDADTNVTFSDGGEMNWDVLNTILKDMSSDKELTLHMKDFVSPCMNDNSLEFVLQFMIGSTSK